MLAFVVTLTVMASSAAARSRRAADLARQDRQLGQKKPLLTSEELALSVEDFMLPAPPRPETEPRYVPFRPRLSRWSAELAAKYWVPPRDIAQEIVQSLNDQYVQRLFQDVR